MIKQLLIGASVLGGAGYTIEEIYPTVHENATNYVSVYERANEINPYAAHTEPEQYALQIEAMYTQASVLGPVAEKIRNNDYINRYQQDNR